MKKGLGVAGDLLIKVTVEDHPIFKRDAENIVSEAKIPFTKAVFGGKCAVDTLKGPTQIVIQPGTQDGTISVIKGAGVRKVTASDAMGDHIVTLRIEVPTNLTEQQSAALKQFASLCDESATQ